MESEIFQLLPLITGGLLVLGVSIWSIYSMVKDAKCVLDESGGKDDK